MFPRLWHRLSRKAGSTKRKPRARRLLLVERLEARQLLTAVPTLTSVQLSAASLVYGQTETLTATVTVAAPNTGIPTGGTVTFLNGNTTLGTAALNSGTATLQVSTLPVGIDVVMANYSGDGANFAPSRTGSEPNSVITTIAGVGNWGYSGDNGPATAAALGSPAGVAVDAAGNVFIADTWNNRIREVNQATGVITTVAGNGIRGYSGDNGPATAAELSSPDGVAVDAAGDLFIADPDSNVIREVNHATGVITTVAGGGNQGMGDNGPATAAELGYPSGIAVDAAGDLFIADQDNNRIREVNHATGLITTVAGNGAVGYDGDNGQATAAELFNPIGVAVDTAGDLYIADVYNARIREVNHATGVITTAAGNGSGSFAGDHGQASGAELHDPWGVAVDAAGDLFIADSGNNRIREVASGAAAATVIDPWVFAGTGAFMGPGTSDMLWFNQASGVAKLWIMSNGALSSTAILGSADPSQWKLLGIGDFMGQGTDDILWQNQSTGVVGAWLISNGAVTGWAGLGSVDLSQWQFAGIGKFKGSSNAADLLWFNQTSGYVVSWIIQNAAVTSGPLLGYADPSVWKVLGIGNFEDHGTDDILWQNQSTGIVGAWVISNAAVTGWDNLGPADPSAWKLIALGDLGNGTPDLVWQNQSTNLVGAWMINNGAVTGWASFGPADPTQWEVIGAGNLAGHATGTGDVLLQNLSSGLVESWIIQGGAVVGVSVLGSP